MTSWPRTSLDIDIYHTDEDKAAYNGGLFWHTLPLRRRRHRRRTASYPRRHGVHGGGPSTEHNYTPV